MRASKGSDFERQICRQLSEWWCPGRSDIFWRSSISGGRATVRTKKGLTTFGSYGDIAAVDPIGAPLIKMFTIELKRGSSYSCPGDLLDFKVSNLSHPWMKCLLQAIKAHHAAGSKSWLMICKRDHRQPIVYLPFQVAKMFFILKSQWRMRLTIGIDGEERFDIIGIRLEEFLSLVTPQQIINLLESHEQTNYPWPQGHQIQKT